MRPEKFGEKKIELNESEKAIVDLLKAKMSMPLDELKLAANLSNKQWDKGIKALGKLGLTKVEKTDSALLVHYTGE